MRSYLALDLLSVRLEMSDGQTSPSSSSEEQVSTASTPLSDHAPVEPAPDRVPLTVQFSRHTNRDPYVAAVSDDAYFPPHHMLTLASKATRLGQSIYHAGARSFNTNHNGNADHDHNDQTPARARETDRASVRTAVSVHLPSWMRDFTARRSRQQSIMPLLSFRNPWSSFKPPGIVGAIQGGLRWGLPEGYVEGGKHSSRYRSRGRTWQETQMELAESDVKVCEPTWDKHNEEEQRNNIRITWLGHATTLVQLPNGINILFDPIFTHRASPSQNAGPHRFTAPPCKIENLPDIDIVCISHNHYDHLSWDCMKKLRKRQQTRGGLKVFCPLGNVGFFREARFEKDSVAEMDWWDEATVSRPGMQGGLKITCTPAQHGSGRSGGDQGISLWSSWLITFNDAEAQSQHRIFFAGDTGLRSRNSARKRRSEFPTCPVFREISLRYGVPQVLLLPISVGSSLSYFRSWDPFPRRFSPFPRVESAMTSAIHMDAEDAAECHAIMTLMRDDSDEARKARADVERCTDKGGVTSIAVHYGTFVRNEQQTREDVRLLRRACRARGIPFVRPRDGYLDTKIDNQPTNVTTDGSNRHNNQSQGRFVVSNQGETVMVPIACKAD